MSVEQHPMESILRMDRMPHIWCPTCGIGTAVTAFTTALQKTGIEQEDVCIVSGIGCSGRIAGYIKLDSFRSEAICFDRGFGQAPRASMITLHLWEAFFGPR